MHRKCHKTHSFEDNFFYKSEGIAFTKSTNLVHDVHRRRVCPEAIVDRDKGDVPLLAVQGGEHHMRGIQRVNEIWWKSISLLYYTWFPTMKLCIAFSIVFKNITRKTIFQLVCNLSIWK